MEKRKSLAENVWNRRQDEFLCTIRQIFTMARWFGIPTYGDRLAYCWTILLIFMLIAIEICSLYKATVIISRQSINDFSTIVAGRLVGIIFYGNGCFSLILSWKFISSWKMLSHTWMRTEDACGYFSPDRSIRRRIITTTVVISVCAFLEHMMSIMAAIGMDCPLHLYFERYILKTHGFLINASEYNITFGILIFVASKVATILWNFQDLIIILISMGIASRYHMMNLYVRRVIRIEKKDKYQKFSTERYNQIQVWRRIREAYARQSSLVHYVNRELGALVLLSNLNNFYFICVQLFLGINKDGVTILDNVYRFVSTAWLLFRAGCVVLAAAEVQIHSRKALHSLYLCPVSAYNIEIKRLKCQLINDYVALSGMGFFSLERQTLLEVGAAIIRYELVLLQFRK